MKSISMVVFVELLVVASAWSATCLTPSHDAFETYTVWFNGFNNGGNGPSGEPSDGSSGGSVGGPVVGPNGEVVVIGPKGEVSVPGTGGEPTSGGTPTSGPSPGGNGGITGPSGEVVGPGGEIVIVGPSGVVTPGPSGGGVTGGGPTPSPGGSPSFGGGSATGGGVTSGGDPSPTPGGPNQGGGGGSVGGASPGGYPSPTPGDGPSLGGGGSTPSPVGPGGPTPGTGVSSPLDPYKNRIIRGGQDNAEGPMARVRPLKNIVNGVSDANFNRSYEAPGYIVAASTRAPGDAKPAPSDQHVVFHDDFEREATPDRYKQQTNGDATAQVATRTVAGHEVSGLLLTAAASGPSGDSSVTVRPTQRVATPKLGQSKVVQWTIGDVKNLLGSTPGSNEKSSQIRLGVVSAGQGDGPIPLCSNERALISIDLAFENQRPDIALLTLTSIPAGSAESFIPFSGYVDFGDFGDEFGYAELALELSGSMIDVTLNGDSLLDRGLFLSEVGLSSIDEFGEFFDVFAQLSNLGGSEASFSLDDLLVYSSEAIPEPGTVALLLLRSACMCLRQRRPSRTS